MYNSLWKRASFFQSLTAEHYKLPGLQIAMVGGPGGIFQDLLNDGIVHGFSFFKLPGKGGAPAADEAVEFFDIKFHGAKVKV